MPRLRERRRHNRWKAPSKREKYARRYKFSKKNRTSLKTGLSHGPNDFCRKGLRGTLIHMNESPKSGIILPSLCEPRCLICKGRQPGCIGGKRTERNLGIYQKSIVIAKQRLKEINDESMEKIEFFRNLAFFYYLQTILLQANMLSLRTPRPSQVFFSLYNQRLTVQRPPQYPEIWVAFQNQLDKDIVVACLPWKTEPRSVAFKQEHRKRFMCLGGSARFLAMHLVPPTQRCRFYIRSLIFQRFFGQSSIHRLIQSGGLDPNYYVYQCRSESYFGK